jgi:chromate transporter
MSNDSDYKLHNDPLTFIVDSGNSPNVSLLEQYERNQKITVFDMFKLSLLLGVTCFGGPKQQQDIFYTTMTKEKKIILHKDFVQLYSLCSVIPGPTTTQVLLSIGLIKTERLLGSLVAVVGFYLPSLLIVLVIAYIFRLFKAYAIIDIDLTQPATSSADNMIINLKIIGTSICQASVALILQSAFYHTNNLVLSSKFQLGLMIVACLIYIASTSFWFMIIIMFGCGIASVFQKDNDYLLDNSSIRLKLEDTPFIGLYSLATFVLIYFVLVMFRVFMGDLSFNIPLIESFYRIGSLSFAGGYSVIPLILSEFKDKMEEYEFLHSYAVLSLLPGPILNLAAYVGTLVNGILSGLLSVCFIVLPGVLLMLAVLPYHEYLKKNAMIQHFLRGASSAFIGFIFSAAFKLWVDSTILSPYASVALGTLNVIVCFILLETFKVYTPLVLLASATVSAFFAFVEAKFII